MQIHELNNYSGNLDSGAYLAIDNGVDTGKLSAAGLLTQVNNDMSDLSDTLNARIDNIIAGGTAPSAAEVTDARLGYNNIVYPSLGDAIRGQAEAIRKARSNYADYIIGAPDLIGDANYTEGYYLDDGGTPVSYSNFHYTSLIPVSEGDYTLFYMSGPTTNPIRIHGYKSDESWDNMIDKWPIGGGPNILQTRVISVPSGIAYIRISTINTKPMLALRPGVGPDINTRLSFLERGIDYKTIDFSDYEAGYIDQWGNIGISGTWSHTNLITVLEGSVVEVSVYGYEGVPVISKFENGVFSPLLIAPTGAFNTFTYTMLEDAAISINFRTYDGASNEGNIQTNVDLSNFKIEISKKIATIESQIKIPYLTMLHKIGVLGDSLSSGEIYNGGTVRDCYNYSWLSNLARDLNVESVHYSQGGLTSKLWWNNTGGFKTALANESVKPTAYFIAFGTNDKNQQEYPIGVITDSAGTDSFVGYMRAIVEYVHQQQPNATIFLVSTYNTSVASTPYNEMISDIADLYSYCFYIDYANNSTIQTTQSNIYVENSHFTTLGYVYVANVIKELTEDAIENNLAWYKHFGLNNYSV